MSTIQYENSSEIPITFQQVDMLNSFYKNYLENNLVKKKELYDLGILKRVIFYRENESLQEVFSMYPNFNGGIEIRDREYVGDYLKVKEKIFKNGEYIDFAVTIYDSEGKEIYEAALNLDDESIILGSVIKYFYKNHGGILNKKYGFHYDEDGEIEYMNFDEAYSPYRGNETADYFGNDWNNMVYYHNDNPMIP